MSSPTALPLVGGSYPDYAPSVNAQRAINLYPVIDARGGRKHLAHTPGLRLLKDFNGYELIGSEMITNGDFADGETAWTLGDQWSVSDGKLVRTPGLSGGISLVSQNKLSGNDAYFTGNLGNWIPTSYCEWESANRVNFKPTAWSSEMEINDASAFLDINTPKAYLVNFYVHQTGNDPTFTLYLGQQSLGNVFLDVQTALFPIPVSSAFTVPMDGGGTATGGLIYYLGGDGNDFVRLVKSAGENMKSGHLYPLDSPVVQIHEVLQFTSGGPDSTTQTSEDMVTGVVAGKTYKLSFIVNSIIGGSLQITLGGTTYQEPIVSSGDYELIITAINNSGLVLSATEHLSINMDNFSIKQVIYPKLELRGLWPLNDYLYVVVGAYLYRLDTSYNETCLNSSNPMSTRKGRVTICDIDTADFGQQIMICDGTTVAYIWDTNDELFTILTYDRHTFLGGGSCTSQDGFFISNRPDTNEFYNSEINDGITWDAADQNNALLKSGSLKRVFSYNRNLWMFKDNSVEVFYNNAAANANLVFKRQSGGGIELGCRAPWSVAAVANSIFWLADDLTVRMTQGLTPTIISTPHLSKALLKFKDTTDAFGFAYGDGGHFFYQLTFPTDNRTFVYDLLTKEWHERMSWRDEQGDIGRHRANCYAFFNKTHVVGDYENGRLYALDENTLTEDDHYVQRKRILGPVTNSRQTFTVACLELDGERGVGAVSGQGEDPVVMLRMSRDGGETWGTRLEASPGKIGETEERTRWHNLGSYKNMAIELSVSDPIEIRWMDLYMRARPGANN